jgi:hypothetical protein
VEVHAGCGLEAAGGSVDEVMRIFTGQGYSIQALEERPPGEFTIVTGTPRQDQFKERFHLIAVWTSRDAEGTSLR